MYGRMICRGLVVGLMCSTASVSFATEPFVQDFDGWKITIRPGASNLAASAPRPNPPPAANPSGSIQLLSLRQDAGPPRPAPENAAAEPAIDGLAVITPGESTHCCDPAPAVSPPEGTVDPRYLSQMYSEIYKSIPFNRAEYNANPSYRHDTTVEFLFGKMRPTVVHRGSTNVNYNSAYGYPYGIGVPYIYGGAGYAYPPLQLVVPGTGLRIHRVN